MDKRILVFTDFSEVPLYVARYTSDLSSDLRCTFSFQHTHHSDSYAVDNQSFNCWGERVYNFNEPNADAKFKYMFRALALQEMDSINACDNTQPNNFLRKDVHNVNAKKVIDNIMLGAGDMTSSIRVVFGMNIINIMENVTTYPAVCICEYVTYIPPKEIVFSIDYKTSFKRSGFKYHLDISQMHQTIIEVVQAKESDILGMAQTDSIKLIETLFRNVRHSFHELEDMSVHADIKTFIDSHGSDMIAFTKATSN